MTYDLLAWRPTLRSTLPRAVIYLLIADEVETPDLEAIAGDVLEAALETAFPGWQAADAPFTVTVSRDHISFELFFSAIPDVLPRLAAFARKETLVLYDPQSETITKADENHARRLKRKLGDPERVAMQAAELVELRAKAETGDARAQVDLGNRLSNGGGGVRRNLNAAVGWYRRAAETGHPDGMFNLAACLQYGDGVEQDVAAAVGWYERAAELDGMYPPFALGDLYLGFGSVARDDDRARAFFTRAQENGHPDAAAALRLLREPVITLEAKRRAYKFWNPRS